MVLIKVNFTSANGQRTLEGVGTASLVSRRHVLTALHNLPLHRMPNSSYMVTAHFGSANRRASRNAIARTKAFIHANPQASTYFVNNSASGSGMISINRHDTALIDVGRQNNDNDAKMKLVLYLYVHVGGKVEWQAN
jgi:V8-like Glu-specific endopeptidase